MPSVGRKFIAEHIANRKAEGRDAELLVPLERMGGLVLEELENYLFNHFEVQIFTSIEKSFLMLDIPRCAISICLEYASITESNRYEYLTVSSTVGNRKTTVTVDIKDGKRTRAAGESIMEAIRYADRSGRRSSRGRMRL